MHLLAHLSLLALACVGAAVVSAQPASGPGMGMGAGPHASAPRSGHGFTPGWPMMTKEERAAHQAAMAGMRSQGECLSYTEQHYRLMTRRARERGLPEPGGSRPDICNGLPK
jgi:hypothetical protein